MITHPEEPESHQTVERIRSTMKGSLCQTPKVEIIYIISQMLFIVCMSICNGTSVQSEFDNKCDLDLTSTVIWNA